jgi:hypothetical protein
MVRSNQLLQRANAFAGPRYGATVSARRLERWVALRLVPGPVPHGQRRGTPPDWEWSSLSYRRVLQVCRIRKRGVTRANAIMFNLWLVGAEYPFSDVRRAAVKEYRRVRKTVARPLPADWDPRVQGKVLPPRSRRAALKGLGAGQSVSPEVEQLPWEILQRIAGSMMFGEAMTPDTMRALVQGLGLPDEMITAWTQNELLAADFDLDRGTLTGLAADPDESEVAAEAALAEADEETFRNVRDYVRVAPWFSAVMPAAMSLVSVSAATLGPTLGNVLAKGAPLLRDPAHRLVLFAIMVRRAQLKGDQARGIGQFARFVLMSLRRLMCFMISNHDMQAMFRQAVAELAIDTNAPLPAAFSSLAVRGDDPVMRGWARKMVRAAWRHGLSDLWKLRKMRPPG